MVAIGSDLVFPRLDGRDAGAVICRAAGRLRSGRAALAFAPCSAGTAQRPVSIREFHARCLRVWVETECTLALEWYDGECLWRAIL